MLGSLPSSDASCQALRRCTPPNDGSADETVIHFYQFNVIYELRLIGRPLLQVHEFTLYGWGGLLLHQIQSTAIIYTLIETAKLDSVDPQAWLTDTLNRIVWPVKRRLR